MRNTRSLLVLVLVFMFVMSLGTPALAALDVGNAGFDPSTEPEDPGTDPDDPGTDPDDPGTDPDDPGTDPDDPGTNPGNSGNGNWSINYYDIIVDETVNGSAETDRTISESGREITIVTDPDDGYEVATVTVVLTSTNSTTDVFVDVEEKGNGRYTFVMPSADVLVSVTFVESQAEEEPFPFIDVDEDDWYYDAIKYVFENDLMSGTSDITFEPMINTSRAMIATILWRLEGSPEVNYILTYEDVALNTWYTEAVRWATSEQIMRGYSDTEFGPDDPVTRQELATILFRYADYKGYDTTARADLSRYEDVNEVAEWALEAMQWVNAEGLITGTTATMLSPTSNASRAEVAVILMRFCEDVVS